jgi:hypothetical protein
MIAPRITEHPVEGTINMWNFQGETYAYCSTTCKETEKRFLEGDEIHVVHNNDCVVPLCEKHVDIFVERLSSRYVHDVECTTCLKGKRNEQGSKWIHWNMITSKECINKKLENIHIVDT